jgi:outer membrane protein assembly factor BamB
MRSMGREFFNHLTTTWYKNSQALRNYSSCWPETGIDYGVPPAPYGMLGFEERVWSIPSAITPNKVVIGCWDNSVHCVNITSLERIWRFQTDGPVYSSPAVLADGSFVIGCEDRVLRRIDMHGRALWQFAAKDSFHGTPTVDQVRRLVYAGSYDHHMYAIDVDCGALVWKSGFSRDIEDDIYSSPALRANGDIIFGSDNLLVCMDTFGERRWIVEADGRFEGTAALSESTGTGVIGTEEGGLIYVFALSDGKVIAKVPTGGFVVSCPSIGLNGLAFVGSNDGWIYSIDLVSGRVPWRSRIGSEFRYTPFSTLPSGDPLFVSVDEKLHCLSSITGERLWDLEMPGGAHSAPLVTPTGKLIVGSHRNCVHFFSWQ